MNSTTFDVRENLMKLAHEGDELRGGEWAECEAWHVRSVDYVRDAMGDDLADDLVTRLALRRGETQADKERSAVESVKEWLSNQADILTGDKIASTYTGKAPKPAKKTAAAHVSAPSSAHSAVVTARHETREAPHGHVGPTH